MTFKTTFRFFYEHIDLLAKNWSKLQQSENYIPQFDMAQMSRRCSAGKSVPAHDKHHVACRWPDGFGHLKDSYLKWNLTVSTKWMILSLVGGRKQTSSKSVMIGHGWLVCLYLMITCKETIQDKRKSLKTLCWAYMGNPTRDECSALVRSNMCNLWEFWSN